MKLSVALCTYNGEKYLSKQLDSILNQEIYAVSEIIVGDDGSTDATLSILKTYQEKYPSLFSIIQNEKNLGSTKNFENAILKCTGDYIFLSDQDDIWQIDKIQKTLQVFKDNPNAEGVFSNASLIDDQDLVFTTESLWNHVFFLEKELQKPIDFLNLITKNGNVITGATLCIKKEVKDFIYPFPTDVLHDEWIAIVLALRESLFYTSEKLIAYRIHSAQQVGLKNLNKVAQITTKKRILLGLQEPNSFSDYRLVLKKCFLKKSELLKIKSYNLGFGNFENRIAECTKELKTIQDLAQSKYPLQYYFSTLLDSLLGKRKN